MTPEKRKKISDLANSVRTALELAPPVDMRVAVERLGGALQFVPPDNIGYEAIVEKIGEGFQILIANDRAETRQNFSVAHEIGHLFLHMGFLVNPEVWAGIVRYEDSVRARYGYSEEEHEANQFAAAFLMPEAEFVAVANAALNDGAFDLSAIAREFGVSESAAKTRGQWLGLFSWT
jgi:Zn-dependent peptidase ImmA (M78 family)